MTRPLIHPEEKDKVLALGELVTEIRVTMMKMNLNAHCSPVIHNHSYLYLLLGFAEGAADRMSVEKMPEGDTWLEYVQGRIQHFKKHLGYEQ